MEVTYVALRCLAEHELERKMLLNAQSVIILKSSLPAGLSSITSEDIENARLRFTWQATSTV